jgi:multiple sugar transport system substrate-binding protein
MMVCTADTVSGTKKRESQSEAFKNNPFEYSFYPIPLTDEGGYFIDSPSIKFSVNKDCDNLDMTNTFMKFLITNKELNAMAANKLLVPPTKVMSFDSLYAPFGQVNEKYIISPEALGINDKLALQIRKASFDVGRKNKTIDEAIGLYGTYK